MITHIGRSLTRVQSAAGSSPLASATAALRGSMASCVARLAARAMSGRTTTAMAALASTVVASETAS